MIRTTLPQCHFKLIQDNANRICKQFSSLKINPKELYFTGYMALLHAQECFQSGRNAKFETFASTCIYHAMLKELAQMHNVVNVPEKKSFDVNYVTINEDHSCDEKWEEDNWEDNAWEWDLWEDDWEDNHYHQRVETLDRLLGQLDPSDRELVQCRYGIGGAPWTLKQLGEARGVSIQAVHKKLHSIEQGLHDSLCLQCA